MLARAVARSPPFMKSVIANLDNDWTLTGADVESAISTMKTS